MSTGGPAANTSQRNGNPGRQPSEPESAYFNLENTAVADYRLVKLEILARVGVTSAMRAKGFIPGGMRRVKIQGPSCST